MKNLSIPKGTRDFAPEEALKRQYIFNTLREVFEQHGFLPLETPAMENLSVLLGKYGEEGDKLLFRILNSGNFLAEVPDEAKQDFQSLLPYIAEKGLRYDLTVPLARFVAMHAHEISFPFRRYQIQPVWRADKPQKGRYREFYQCDIDVIGTNSLLEEVNILEIINHVFEKLGIRITIKLNHRKILAGIAEHFQLKDRFYAFTVIIDKIDKIGMENVIAELQKNDFPSELVDFFKTHMNQKPTLDDLRYYFKNNSTIQQAIEDLKFIFDTARAMNLTYQPTFDYSLARGLNYYTGTIFEVIAQDIQMGSICGGGRYDDLTGIFNLPGYSGVGISFGADRIYDVMEALQLFPTNLVRGGDVLILQFEDSDIISLLRIARTMRKNGFKVMIFPDVQKIKKQMSYADKLHFTYAIMQGSNELMKNELSIKSLLTGKQIQITVNDIASITPENISSFFETS